jgi:hypothetical protein
MVLISRPLLVLQGRGPQGIIWTGREIKEIMQSYYCINNRGEGGERNARGKKLGQFTKKCFRNILKAFPSVHACIHPYAHTPTCAHPCTDGSQLAMVQLRIF